MQKAINVIKYKIILLNFFLLGFNGCSQLKLSGKYCKKDILGNFSECINFEKDNKFKYKEYNHLGISKYGKGMYSIESNHLTLNFNLSSSKNSSIFKILEESELKNDSIQLKFIVKDSEGVLPYPYNGAIEVKNKVYLNLNKEGVVFLKKTKQDTINLKLKNLNYDSLEIKLKANRNYVIEVFLSEFSGNILQDFKKIYQIKNTNDSIMILNHNGIKSIWKKTNSN